MSSFTFSSRWEWLTVAVSVMMLLACEAGYRAWGGRYSADLRGSAELPIKAQRLGRDKLDGRSMLVLGNSYVIDGLDVEVFSARWREETGRGPRMESAAFLAAQIQEWYWIFKEHFTDAGLRRAQSSRRTPDVLVLPLWSRNAIDRQDFRRRRLPRFLTWRGVLTVAREDIDGFGNKMEFLLSSLSLSFAHGNGVRVRVLERLVPSYLKGSTQVHDIYQRRLDRAEVRKPAARTYTVLRRLLALARARRVRVVFVFVPRPEEYEIFPDLRKEIIRGGGLIVDCREIPALGGEHYTDVVHLNPDGAKIFSSTMVERMIREHPAVFGVRKP